MPTKSLGVILHHYNICFIAFGMYCLFDRFFSPQKAMHTCKDSLTRTSKTCRHEQNVSVETQEQILF